MSISCAATPARHPKLTHLPVQEITIFTQTCPACHRLGGGMILTLLLLLLPAGATMAQNAFVAARAALPKVLVKGKMRVFYNTEGPHAVEAMDANTNGTPDQVEDITTQVQGAWSLLVEGLGFPAPFEGERYRSVKFLDIHLLNKELLKNNGLTYDEVQRFKRSIDPEGTTSLCFDLATSVKAPANLTPAHEMFHVIQNGVTYFKTKWFAEGTARWSEAALGSGGVGNSTRKLRGTWPPNEAALQSVFEMSYDASPMYWEPLGLAQDRDGKIPADRVPATLKDLCYVGGEPVMKDLNLNGWEVIRDVLMELGQADDAVLKERGLQKWAEAEQKSAANSPAIHGAVMKVMQKLQKKDVR